MRILTSLFFLQLTLTVNAQIKHSFISDTLISSILHEGRGLRVILPDDYEPGSDQRYEVLYILDGEWYQELVPFTYNFAQGAGYAPKSIFVLILNRYPNGINSRDRDFSPTAVPGDSLSGGADRFYDFLTKEVVPYVEKKYPASGQRSLIGSSFGGLFSVYAFVKDATFFQSFISSDPNLLYDQHYVTRLAAKKLSQLDAKAGTLFIAGRPDYYKQGGVFSFDSLLKASAPATLHWKCVSYPNETHYSIQLKAFYEGFRFSHFGYAASPPEFHPMNGMTTGRRSFPIYFLNSNEAARFTVDGTEPTPQSPVMNRDDTFSIKVPARLWVKTFSNRVAYNKEWTANFTTGQLSPPPVRNKKAKGGLNYVFFTGTWSNIPDTRSLSPLKTGVADSTLNLHSVLHQQTGLLVIEGMLDIQEEGEYIFYANGYVSTELTVGNKLIFADTITNGKSSFIVSMKKGKYPMRLKFLYADSPEAHFAIFKNVGKSSPWWENRLLNF